MLKASFGGAGAGMRVVKSADELAQSWRRRSAKRGRRLGGPDVFIERYIARAKHIEVQILATRTGTLYICGSGIARCSGAPEGGGGGAEH